MAHAFIGIGSNLGERQKAVEQALFLLDYHCQITVVDRSQMHETDPEGGVATERFLNGAALLKTSLDPTDLLQVLLAVEEALGRERFAETRWGNRAIDLDLLLYDDRVITSPALMLPHPRMHERAFVLGPLCEIAPETIHPQLHKSIAELFSELPKNESNKKHNTDEEVCGERV